MPDFPASWISGPSALTHAVSNEDMYLSGPITLGSGCNTFVGLLLDLRIEAIL